jgi:beta-N-acetylhexosaminidase
MKNHHFIRLYILFAFVLFGQANAKLIEKEGDELSKTWANTKMAGMSLEEKVGQIFMIDARTEGKGQTDIKSISRSIDNFHVGGIAFFKGNALKQAQMTLELQEVSKIPMLIAMDAEWGLGMRLENTISFPRQLTLGAIQDNRLIYEMGREIGSQLKMIGTHINFAPVVDVNSIPDNPVIHDRSFGQDKKNVSRKAYAYMKGMQDMGLIACAKHFPGHGSTIKDSHKTLPSILKPIEEIESEELFPFRLMFKQGIKSVMVGHLQVPALDNRPERPTSLSEKAVEQKIRQELNYEGLIITDALNMGGVANHFKPGEIEVEAFIAGNDILLMPQDISKAFYSVLNAVEEERISLERLEKSVLRILMSKFDAGLFFPPEIQLQDLEKRLNNGKAMALKQDLYKNALCYFKGSTKGLPIEKPASKKIATLCFGSKEQSPFQDRVSSYTEATHFYVNDKLSGNQFKKLQNELKTFETVLVSFNDMEKSMKKDFGVKQQSLDLIKEVNAHTETHIVLFGSPYSLHLFDPAYDIIMAFEKDAMAQDMAAQAIFGSIDVKGKLPVDGGKEFPVNSGLYLTNARILAYDLPESVGLSSDTLNKIESIVEEMIRTHAAPGCQILVAKDGKIVYDKVFGYHTYQEKREVRKDDIYDLASITKVMATTLATMRLYEKGDIDIFKPLDDYVDGYIDTSNKKEITIIEALTHHAGLKPWIPFYRLTLDTLRNKQIIPSKSFYSRTPMEDYTVQVAKDLYIRSSFKDSISRILYGSPLNKNKEYKYSDLGLYMIRDVIDTRAGMPLDEFVNDEFFNPLDLVHTGFNPAQRYPIDQIVPTEEDDYFRKQRIQGFVHDMGAAMLGGVSGHAGLFSNSKDLAVLMQMLLNKGIYANKNYFDHKTIYTFTTRYHRSSRRGIGFDMKELDNKKNMNMSELAPASTFGHLGFTGTCVFGDPDNNIVYVFLSNRTYPSMHNSKFAKENYRSRIQSVIYNAFIDPL